MTPRKLLVANRGEIALRVMRTAKEMGIATVAVYSEADRDARHVRYADEAYLAGPAAPSLSYLNGAAIIEIARSADADAIHPGYGFLSENAGFARDVIAAGITWVGPNPAAIDAMGDKIRARQAMVAAGVPVVPGDTEPLGDADAAVRAAARHGLPLALKASGGGGGKGLKIARTIDEIPSAFAVAQREAAAYFKNPIVYAERYLENPKHIELQILGDKHGNVIHIGERDCSLQRRHQKLWEEAPARISESVRHQLRHACVNAAKAIGYDSAGTIECLVLGEEFYFLELNARIQVEHTVSEEISGLDLIRAQILVASGEPLRYSQADIDLRGHAIEIRVNAEDPAANFAPAPGTIVRYREPGGIGVRVDSAAFAGARISPDYDSMIAKLIVHAPNRTEALARLTRAIDEFAIEGVPTTLGFLRALAAEPSVAAGSMGTQTLEAFAAHWKPAEAPADMLQSAPADVDPGDDVVRVEVNGRMFAVRVLDRPAVNAGPVRKAAPAKPPPKRTSNGRANAAASGNDVVAPIHGVVVELNIKEGETVQQGDVVAVIEAMKMMNEIRAHRAGTIAKIHASLGATVEAQSALVTLA
jgi:acetyl-CoA/propionyl-CoA carboxylase biotin carboxyl carrier protein